MRDPSQPRHAVCKVIHEAYLHANKKIKGQGIAKLCGWGPWGPTEPLRVYIADVDAHTGTAAQ
jgi:hypothetical protein|eukprot:COSAG01_NODE_2849_length_6977_cov_66.208200_1_plen_63_part_00